MSIIICFSPHLSNGSIVESIRCKCQRAVCREARDSSSRKSDRLRRRSKRIAEFQGALVFISAHPTPKTDPRKIFEEKVARWGEMDIYGLMQIKPGLETEYEEYKANPGS